MAHPESPDPIQADPRLAALRPDLLASLERAADHLRPRMFPPLLDGLMRRLMEEAFEACQAHEGTLWVVDIPQRSLVPVFNSGPHADRLVGAFRQPVQAGLISMVYATEQPFLENQVRHNKRQSKKLDRLLQVQTCALLVVPFYFVHRCRGVLSCVQLKNPRSRKPDPPGFQPAHLTTLQQASTLVGHLLDRRLLAQLLDLPWK